MESDTQYCDGHWCDTYLRFILVSGILIQSFNCSGSCLLCEEICLESIVSPVVDLQLGEAYQVTSR